MAILYARDGGETVVNTTTSDQQLRPKTAPLSGGGYVIVWQDWSGQGGDSSLLAVKGQRYDANGQRVGGEFLVNTSTYLSQQEPSVTATANGGFFVAWTDFSGSGGDFDGSVKGQFFDSAGAKVGGEILLNTVTAGHQMEPSVASLADGAIAVTWSMPASGALGVQRSYQTQVFEANGAKRGTETAVSTAGGHEGSPAQIIGLTGGGYVVSWESHLYVYARVFDAGGNPTGAAFKLSDSIYGGEQYQTLQATPDGGFIAAWAHWAEADRNDIVARRFTATGEPAGASFVVTATATGQQFAPDIAAIPGGYIITWQDGFSNFTTWDIKGQIYDTSLVRSGSEFFVNTDKAGDQTDAQISVLTNGKIVVTWQGLDGYQGTAGIKAQLLTPSSGPTDIALDVSSVVETAVENIPVGTVTSSSAVNSTVTYQYIGDSAGGAFRLEGDKLVVNDNARLDFETAQSVGITLRATDGEGHSYDEVIVLQVTDSNREARYSAGPISSVQGATSETAHLSNGGFVHIRQEFSSVSAFLDVYDANGTLVRTDVLHSEVEEGTTAAGLVGGNFVVTWSTSAGGGDGSGQGVQAQLYDNAGNVISGVIPVNTTTHNSQVEPDVAALSGGGFVIAWGSLVSSTDLFAQIFDSAGNKVGSEFIINEQDNDRYQQNVEITGLTSGGFVVTWTDFTAQGEVMAQVFSATGAPVSGVFTVNTTQAGNQSQQKVVALDGGGFVVVWEDDSPTGGDTSGLATRAQVFDNLGNKVGGEILVNTNTTGAQENPNVDAMPDGGFVVAWQDHVFSTDPLVETVSVTRLQFFDAAGNRSGPEFKGNTEGTWFYTPALVALDDGDLFLSWGGGVKRFLTLEQAAVANNDTNTTPENAFVHGNLLANDTAQPGTQLQVAAVQGQAANVGETITLPSGATVQVNANGNYTYDPNSAFNHLVGASGAANHSATDSFTYTLANGTSATATITVTGVGSNGDRPQGTAGNDVIVGTDAAELFDLDQGGNDTVHGNGGNDAFYFGGTLTSADIVTGGAGIDTLILQGNYSGGVTIGTGVTGIEALSFFAGNNTGFGDPGTNLYDYVITTSDSNFAAGLQVKVNAAPLLVGEDFTFNGSAETDATFLVYGGKGVDTLTGGNGSDIFFFADDNRLAPGDTINGGAGHDGLFLRGNYVIDFSAPGYSNLLTSIENITVTSIADERYARGGGTEFDYSIKFGDAQVPAGGVLTVSGVILRTNETLVVDGSLETNGAFRLFGGSSDDILTGGAGADFFDGGWGSDWLTGGGGADSFQGGYGADILAGGGGGDVFRYRYEEETPVAGSDHILDFTADDWIDVSGIDANTRTPYDESFYWIGGDAFISGAFGRQLRGTADGNVWTIQGETDGDGIADFQIIVTVADGHILGQSDFIL